MTAISAHLLTRIMPTARARARGGLFVAAALVATSLAPVVGAAGSGTWTPVGSMSTPRASHTATLLPSGMVLVAGGEDNYAALASAELYDPATGRWAPTGSMTMARYAYTATLLPGGGVLAAGGGPSSTASAELYRP